MTALFQNRQWAVTEHGIESIKPAPTYPIEARRLLAAIMQRFERFCSLPTALA
jgi:hypothetical protein